MITHNLSIVWVTYLVCVECHWSQKLLVGKITGLNVTATVAADVHFTTSKKKLQNKRNFKNNNFMLEKGLVMDYMFFYLEKSNTNNRHLNRCRF